MSNLIDPKGGQYFPLARLVIAQLLIDIYKFQRVTGQNKVEKKVYMYMCQEAMISTGACLSEGRNSILSIFSWEQGNMQDSSQVTLASLLIRSHDYPV